MPVSHRIVVGQLEKFWSKWALIIQRQLTWYDFKWLMHIEYVITIKTKGFYCIWYSMKYSSYSFVYSIQQAIVLFEYTGFK